MLKITTKTTMMMVMVVVMMVAMMAMMTTTTTTCDNDNDDDDGNGDGRGCVVVLVWLDCLIPLHATHLGNAERTCEALLPAQPLCGTALVGCLEQAGLEEQQQ